MDSNRIKGVALGARDALTKEVSTSLDRVLSPDSPERVANSAGVSTIEHAIDAHGRDEVVERVAYTWFNRLCALRYMDVRGYAPVGLVSPREGETLPAVLADARRGIYSVALGMSARDKESVAAVLGGRVASRDPLGRAYVMLLLAACKTYERSMGYLFGFERDLGPAIELLAPTDLLGEGSILRRICDGLDEDTCAEGVEVMGWLYQFYVSERKDAFFASKKKATAADIAPATQLFTPNWIVRYLVENSLGRLWMLNFPDSELAEHMEYYVRPEEPEDDFLKVYSPEDITFLDPACGSGHILVYAFDLLYQMYEEEGYRPADVPSLILKNNLTGIEIDDRAAEIASFCLEMKALEKDPGFLGKDVDANILVTHKFDPTPEQRKLIPKLCANAELMDVLTHFDEVGSLYEPAAGDVNLMRKAEEAVADNTSLDAAGLRHELASVRSVLQALSNTYSVAVTNPPYMGSGNMNAWLSRWVKDRYSDERADLCTCFIKRCLDFNMVHGYSALITMQSWMFIGSYESLRSKLLHSTCIATMAHLGAHAFNEIGGEVVSTTATVFISDYSSRPGFFIRLVDFNSSDEKASVLHEAIEADSSPYVSIASKSDFAAMPGSPIAYWASSAMKNLFRSTRPFDDSIAMREGIHTAKNEFFLRLWWEVSHRLVVFGATSFADIDAAGRWVPYCKGGQYRKWYGNNDYLIGFDKSYRDYMQTFSGRVWPSQSLWFKEGGTWTAVSTGNLGVRYYPKGFLFDAGGQVLVGDNCIEAIAALNSSLYSQIAELTMPTLNFKCGVIKTLPDIRTGDLNTVQLAEKCISIAKTDWDAFETSWDFAQHPLVRGSLVSEAFDAWSTECRERFDTLKSNEEELNLIFARIYGMEKEVPIEVPDDKVSVRLADLQRDVKSVVSYGVGCIFGRYSLDVPGLVLADEGSTLDDFHTKVPNPTFDPDKTGIIPITEGDTEWFEDDIVAQFRRWLAAAYGEDTLDENVAFIERALGKTLRQYFVRDFYNDHLKIYQKRPIYWLFQSPRKGFSALVYLHRYDSNTVNTLLTEYVRPLRERMDAQARLLEVTGNARDASTAAKYRATIEELNGWEHDVIFPLAQKHVVLDLDEGVKKNYGKAEFKGALRKVAGLS